MRTEKIEQAALLVAERVVFDTTRGVEGACSERCTTQMNAERWVGTPLAGAHFDALGEKAVSDRARWLAGTEAGWNLLDRAAQERAEAL